MASAKKKAGAKPSVKFRDLKSKKNPKGGFSWGAKRDSASPNLDKTS